MPDLMALFEPQTIWQFRYKNHRGEIAVRTVQLEGLWLGHTAWHPKDQWLLRGLDLDKNERRDFALADVIDGVIPALRGDPESRELHSTPWIPAQGGDDIMGA